MRKNTTPSFILTTFILFLLTSCGTQKWKSSFTEAKQLASKSNQEIFMVISQGEPSSADFKTNVLDSKEFLSAVSKDFVLLYINLSADGLVDLTQEQLEKTYEENSKIIRDYNITEELTMLRLSSEGYCLDAFPFIQKYLTPSELVADIKSSNEKVLTVKKIISTIKKSSDTDKVKAIDELYEYTDEKYKNAIMPLCHEVLNLDQSNSSGLLGKYEIIVAYDEADKILSKENVEQAVKLFTSIADGGHLDRSQKFEAYFTAAYLYALVGSTDFDSMIKLLEKAYAINPNDAHAKDATDLLETIQNMKIVYEDSQKINQQALEVESSEDNIVEEGQ